MDALIENIAKRAFAFGLQWVPAVSRPAEDVAVALSLEDGVAARGVRFTVVGGRARSRKGEAERGTSGCIGILDLTNPGDAPKSVRAAGAVVAKLGRDAVYLALLPSGAAWLCGVRGNEVIPATDAVGALSEIRSRALALAGALELPLIESGVDDLPDASSFALEKVFAKSRVVALRPLARGFKAYLPLVAASVFAGIGLFGYRTIHPDQPDVSPAEQLAMDRDAYVAGVVSAVGVMPSSSQWVLDAYWFARNNLPPYFAGWALDGVTCTPVKCSATYSATNSVYAFTPLQLRFGKTISLLPNGTTARVDYPLANVPAAINLIALRSLPTTNIHVADWIGRVPVALAGAAVEGQPLVNNLGGSLNAAGAQMPFAVLEQVNIGGDAAIENESLGQIVADGSWGGFLPVRFEWSFGVGRQPAGWKMVWARLHQ